MKSQLYWLYFYLLLWSPTQRQVVPSPVKILCILFREDTRQMDFLGETPFYFLHSFPFGTAGHKETICRRALISQQEAECLFSPLQCWVVVLPKPPCSSSPEAVLQAQVEKFNHLFLPKYQDKPWKIQNTFWVRWSNIFNNSFHLQKQTAPDVPCQITHVHNELMSTV